jgi:adenosylcobinamide amidohydrolase
MEIVEGVIPQSRDKSFICRKHGKTMVVSFALPRPALSWAIYNGGFHQRVSHVIIHAVDSLPVQSARQAASRLHLRGTVIGMMIRNELDFHTITAAEEDLHASAIVAADCSMMASTGTRPVNPIDTHEEHVYPTAFNIILVTNYHFTQEAMLEAISIATEAKSRAIHEFGLRTPSGEPATGGMADCVAVVSGHDRRYKRCCKGDTWGMLIGRASLECMRRALIDSIAIPSRGAGAHRASK